jgi:hypothetical protein
VRDEGVYVAPKTHEADPIFQIKSTDFPLQVLQHRAITDHPKMGADRKTLKHHSLERDFMAFDDLQPPHYQQVELA